MIMLAGFKGSAFSAHVIFIHMNHNSWEGEQNWFIWYQEMWILILQNPCACGQKIQMSDSKLEGQSTCACNCIPQSDSAMTVDPS